MKISGKELKKKWKDMFDFFWEEESVSEKMKMLLFMKISGKKIEKKVKKFV